MTDDVTDGPLLSGDQTLWIFIALGWFVLGGAWLAVGKTLFGVAAVLVGFGSAYRIARPG